MEYYEEYVPIGKLLQYFLHCPVPGSDAVLLYLHGGPGFSAAYHAHLLDTERFPCTLVFYDQRGTGKTLRKNRFDPPTFSLLLEDLHSTISYLKEKYPSKKILLLGHSWGSVLGTQYVQKYPDAVSAYIGMGQVINMLRGEKIAFSELKRRIFSRNKLNDVKKYRQLENRLSFASPAAFQKSSRGLRLLQYRYGFYPKIYTAVKNVCKSPVFSIKDVFSFLAAPRMNKILNRFLWEFDTTDTCQYALPVYYILGKEDWQVPSTLAAQHFQQICAPIKQLFWIDAAGHSTDIENPAAFRNALQEILRQICD